MPPPLPPSPNRCSIGDNSVLGDTRWAGVYGVDAEFVADEDCKVTRTFGQPWTHGDCLVIATFRLRLRDRVFVCSCLCLSAYVLRIVIA